MSTQAEGRLEVLRTRPCAVRCAGSGYRVAVELQHRGPVQCRRLRRRVVNAMTLQDWALILAIGSIILNVLAEIIKHW